MTCYEQDFYIVAKREIPKIVEEIRRANELKAIELKMRMDMPFQQIRLYSPVHAVYVEVLRAVSLRQRTSGKEEPLSTQEPCHLLRRL